MKEITIRKKCPKCDGGEMISVGDGYSNSAGTHMSHRCKSCYHRESYTGLAYPVKHLEFTPEEQETRWEN